MASSPARSPAAAVKVSSARRKHRSTRARNSAFLVGKSRNRYGWLIPARRATSSVEVPASPWAANSATAASRTSSRRSAAGIRCLVIVLMATKLVMTHYFVKGCVRMVRPARTCQTERDSWHAGRAREAAGWPRLVGLHGIDGTSVLFRTGPALGADPDGLGVAELADAVVRQLAAESGRLYPAERQLGVGGHVAVHEDHPGREVPDEPGPLGFVVGPGVRAQAEVRGVGQLDRLLD